MDPSSGSGATGISKSELKKQELVVGACGFEPQTSCAQGSCKKSILLVRLALFCVMVHGFGPNLAVGWTQVGPKFWDQADSRHARSRRLFEGTRSRVVACITLPTPQRSCVPIAESINGVWSVSTNPNPGAAIGNYICYN